MRVLGLLLVLLALLPFAGATGSLDFASRADQCQPVYALAAGVPQIPFCPYVHQHGTATPAACDTSGVVPVCTVRVQGVADGLALPVGAFRDIQLQAQVFDGSQPALVVCDATDTQAALTCGGVADFTVPVPAGGCTPITIRAVLSDIGAAQTFEYRLETGYEMRVCETAGQATLELS